MYVFVSLLKYSKAKCPIWQIQTDNMIQSKVKFHFITMDKRLLKPDSHQAMNIEKLQGLLFM